MGLPQSTAVRDDKRRAKALAAQKKVTLLADVDAKLKAARDRLAKAKGPGFDAAFMSQIVTDHQAAVRYSPANRRAASTLTWAAKTLRLCRSIGRWRWRFI